MLLDLYPLYAPQPVRTGADGHPGRRRRPVSRKPFRRHTGTLVEVRLDLAGGGFAARTTGPLPVPAGATASGAAHSRTERLVGVAGEASAVSATRGVLAVRVGATSRSGSHHCWTVGGVGVAVDAAEELDAALTAAAWELLEED